MNDLKPKHNVKESELFDNDEFKMNEADNAADSNAPKAENPMDEQQLRIESLKIATKISKLFDNVQPSDLLEMSDKVYNFIQHQNNSGEYDENYGLEDNKTEETPEEDTDFDMEDVEVPEESSEEKSDEENAEDETNEEGDLNPEDIFDFEV